MTANPKIERIRKLLAMAESPTANENEADTARKLAESLMSAVGVTEADVREADAPDPVATVRGERDPKPQPAASWYGIAAAAVVRVVGCFEYRDQSNHRIWVGTDDQRETARELYAWVVRQIETLSRGAAKIVKGRSDARSYLHAYRVGVASAIAKKAREMVEFREREAPPVGEALVLRDRLAEAIKKATPDGLVRTKPARVSLIGYAAGRADGESIGLRRDVAGTTVKRLGSGS